MPESLLAHTPKTALPPPSASLRSDLTSSSTRFFDAHRMPTGGPCSKRRPSRLGEASSHRGLECGIIGSVIVLRTEEDVLRLARRIKAKRARRRVRRESLVRNGYATIERLHALNALQRANSRVTQSVTPREQSFPLPLSGGASPRGLPRG
jgi:hypothetical protein